jgi:hypothetical protein
MRKLLLSIILSLFVFAGFSQKYLPGYILTNEGDTIHGELLNQNEVEASKKCILRNEEEIKTFLPNDINGYRYSDGNYYISKEIVSGTTNTPVFLRFLLKGTIELYVYYSPLTQKEMFYILKDDKIVELENNESIIYKDGSRYKRYDKKYIGILKYLYSDAPEVLKDVDKLSFSSGALIKISEDYHNFVCADETCETFKRKGKRMHFGIKPFYRYESSKINLDRTYIVKTDDFNLRKSNSSELKSNSSFAYGLGLSIISTDRKAKFEYSISKQLTTYGIDDDSGDFPIYGIDNENNILEVNKLNHQFLFSYAFTDYMIQPFMSFGGFFEQFKSLGEVEAVDFRYNFPTYAGGLIGEIGVRYNYKHKIYLELNGYYAGTSRSVTNQTDETIMKEKFYGVNIGLNFILF